MITIKPVEEVAYDAGSAYADFTIPWGRLGEQAQGEWQRAAEYVQMNPDCTGRDLIRVMNGAPPREGSVFQRRLLDTLEAFIRAVRDYRRLDTPSEST